MVVNSLYLNQTVVTSFANHGPSATNTNTTTTTTTTTTDSNDGVYVLHIEACPSSSFISCALSDHSIHLYDRQTLQNIQKLPNAHKEIITDLSFVSKDSSPFILASSSQDGYVHIYDLRQPITTTTTSTYPCIKCQTPNHEKPMTFSLGYGGTLLAMGTDQANIHFMDARRTPSTLLGSYVDAHTDEVTSLTFSSSTSTHLCSSSEDALLCVFDTSQPSEESALQSVMNVNNTPIRTAGFFGTQQQGLYCLTGSETLSVYHWESAQPIHHFGGLQLRNDLTQFNVISSPIQYMIGCHWNESANALYLLAGSYDGNTAVFQVNADSIEPLYALHSQNNSGHQTCIRAFDWYQPSISSSPILITGGEDSKLCQWLTTPKHVNDKHSKGIRTTVAKKTSSHKHKLK